MGKDLSTSRATYHHLSAVDLVNSLSEILSIVKEFDVFELNLFLSDVDCPISSILNCLNSTKRGSSFNCADNYGNQMPNSRYVWKKPKRTSFVNSLF